jgi:hypothetical protein
MMSETRWTPGPWNIIEGDSVVFIESAKRKIAATNHAPYWHHFSEIDLANAHLIAAAPDLYAALDAITARYVSIAVSGDCGFWNPENEPEVVAARAALSRARGEKP